jgi:hypothetical protein
LRFDEIVKNVWSDELLGFENTEVSKKKFNELSKFKF